MSIEPSNQKQFNISVSGWSGSGATSLALILTNLLSYQYLHLGGVFRFLGEQLGHSEEGFNRPQFDDYIEPIIGSTLDRYRDYKLLESEGILTDSDLGTFIIGKHPKVFSVFLKSSFEERSKKVLKDNRDDAITVLKERDTVNREFFLKLHNVDVFDEELIDRKFNLVIDNSHINLESEVRMVLEQILSTPHLKGMIDLENIYTQMEQEVRDFSVLGKDNYRDILKDKNLILTAPQIIEEVSKTFPEDLSEFPEKIQNIFLGRK